MKQIKKITINKFSDVIELIKMIDTITEKTKINIEFIRGTIPERALTVILNKSIHDYQINVINKNKAEFAESLSLQNSKTFSNWKVNFFFLMSKLYCLNITISEQLEIINFVRTYKSDKNISTYINPQLTENIDLTKPINYKVVRSNLNSSYNLNNFFINILIKNNKEVIQSYLDIPQNTIDHEPVYCKGDRLMSLFSLIDEHQNLIEPTITEWLHHIFCQLHNIERLFDMEEDLIFSKEKTAKKNIVLLTGQLRSELALERLKQIYKVTKNMDNVEYYLVSWKDYVIKEDVLGKTKDNEYLNWAERFSPEIKNSVPKIIKNGKLFKNKLPETYKMFDRSEVKEPFPINKVKKIIPKIKIKLYDEKTIEEEYFTEEILTRHGTLNQFKQNYLLYKSFKFIEENVEGTYNILRIRPDLIILKRPSKPIDHINSFYCTEIDIAYMSDSEFYMTREQYRRTIYELARIIVENKTFTIFKINGKKIRADSHKLLKLFFVYNSLNFVSIINAGYLRLNMYSSRDYFDDFWPALKSDLAGVPLNEAKEIESFFAKIKIYKK